MELAYERGESSHAASMRVRAAAVPLRRSVVPVEAVKHQRAVGPAAILAIGTATPPNVVEQATYPDFYFEITNCNEQTALKARFRKLCERSGINQRHFFLTEKMLNDNPSLCTYMESSLDVRQSIAIREVPRLAEQAAIEALKDWGQSRQMITHVVFATSCGINMPGADLALTRLLKLRPTVQRVMLYQQGSIGGAAALRAAKDLAENNKGARVLTVVSEINCFTFRAPDREHMDNLIGAAIYSDGASALIIGSDPISRVERPIFEIHWCAQKILPESDGALEGRLTQAGLIYHLFKDVPGLVSRNTLPILTQAIEVADFPQWNDVFWCVHPGGKNVLDEVERTLQLNPRKLEATREVLRDYGNMSGASVLFVLDRLRRRSFDMEEHTTGEGCEWGLVFGFGPGLTLEVTLLRSCPTG